MSQSILAQMPSIHNLSITDIDGKTISLSRFKGKKILFVNVASECGYTPQYTDLQQLHEKYKDKLVIIGMPCNDFGGQEPGNEAKIKQFCSSKYHVTFMMASKVNIKSNPISPVYEWLTQKKLNGKEDSDVNWNFNKYLIDEEGHYIAHYRSGVKPMSEELISAISK
ncbi:MAG: glutathione peroxidase [Bacteroidota bacterium]|jgi:glutathione peroxidase